METITRSLNYEQPQDLHFDKYALHILENSRTPNLADTTTIALASSPSITSFDASAAPLTSHITTTSEFFKKLGADFFQSLQSQPQQQALTSKSHNNLDIFETPVHTITSSGNSMDMDLGRLIMDSSVQNSAMDEYQNQLNYDKFMNGIWIGVVLALILISMIFCFCSCFLYHQFRVWKRNYRTTVTQNNDVEAVKLNLDMEDPVPEYTLVSGLPSYEAALELLHKTPKSCLIVHPSVFEVFNRNEKSAAENNTTSESNTTSSSSSPSELAQPLLNSLPSYTEATTTPSTPTMPVLTYNHSLASLLSLNQPQKSLAKTKSTACSSPSASEAEKQFKS